MIKFRQSFRFRIIALTIVVSGTVLLAFSAVSRYTFHRILVGAVDQNLSALPFPDFPHPYHAQSWEWFANATSRVSSRMFQGGVHIVAYGADGKEYFKSEYWPEGLSVKSLPLAKGEIAMPEMPEVITGEFRKPGPGGNPRGRGRERREQMQIASFLVSRMSEEGEVRFGVFEHGGYNVALGVELRGISQEVSHVMNAFRTSLPVAIAVLAIGAWLIASRAIKPIRKLTATAESMSAAKLGERIVQGNEDKEFSELINVFNGMLERLERSFLQATRFSADAAHELKTPLTILQGHLESALQEAPDDSDQQRKLAMLLGETQRLRGITRRLLLLAQADAGQLKVRGESTKIGELIHELVEDFEMQSSDCEFRMAVDESVTAVVDRSLVTQIVQNLLSNAVKYNAEDEPWVEVSCEDSAETLSVEVSNGGPGIPEEYQERLFGRFMRVDSARNRSVDGFGLGLNLSREFARVQGGELELVESAPGKTRFRLTLPKAV